MCDIGCSVRILAMDPHTKREKTDKSPAPLCHSGCTEKKREFKAAFREFVSAYKSAYQRVLKHSLRLEFPIEVPDTFVGHICWMTDIPRKASSGGPKSDKRIDTNHSGERQQRAVDSYLNIRVAPVLAPSQISPDGV